MIIQKRLLFFFFSSRRRHTRFKCDWSSDVCSSDLFKRQSGELDTSGEKKVRTEGLWVKCDECRQIIWKKDLEDNLNVCTKCDKHFRIDARARLAQLLDDSKYDVFDSNLVSTDPLKFVDLKSYSSRLKRAKADTGLKDAIINAHGKLNGRPVIVSSMEYSFICGSIGAE